MENLKGRQLKTAVRDALTNEDWQTIIYTLIEEYGTKLTSALFSASYDNEAIIKWRSVSSFGLLAKWLDKNDSVKNRIIMRRCVWMLTEESGGIPWNVPAIMGEIMANSKEMAEDYINILFSYIDEKEEGPENFLEYTPLRKSVYWGLMRVSQVFPDLIQNHKELIRKRVVEEDEDEILFYLSIIIKNSKLTEFEDHIETIKEFGNKLEIFYNGEIMKKTLNEIFFQ
jgi:hypothetical protein